MIVFSLKKNAKKLENSCAQKYNKKLKNSCAQKHMC